MNINDITLVIAIDKHHTKELTYTWPTWMKYKPELRTMKKVVIYDKDQVNPNNITLFNGFDIKFVPWSMDGVEQREKMLTSFIKVPPVHVDTSWYLKLDVDAIATKHSNLYHDAWFDNSPVFVSHRWGYSKPPDILDRLDAWGDITPPFSQHPRLNIPRDPASPRVSSPRIISWCFFGRTDWTTEISNLCGPRLPVPSQDTIMYYCATRLGKHYARVNVRALGWEHLRFRALRAKSAELMNE